MTTDSLAIRAARRAQDRSAEFLQKGWYHSFSLPGGATINGVLSLPHLIDRYARFPIPADLHGKRVLDIGAWDGWFTFEAERRGASVTAVDCVELATFLDIRARLGSRADYRVLDVYELPAAGLGQFDIVFFLGVLYHVKHPLLALEIVCALATDVVIVESFVTDADHWREHVDDIPAMEFYETSELGNGVDNWIGPTVGCLMAMCRAAGFARVDLLHASGVVAGVACYRKWEPAPADSPAAPPELLSAANNRTLGINFSSRKDEYIDCHFRSSRDSIARGDLCLEVGRYGVPALYAGRAPGCEWFANFRLPPGLPPGWHAVRLRFRDSKFGEERRIAVDMPLAVERLTLKGVADSLTWDAKIHLAPEGFLSCWIDGLPENADRANVRLQLGAERLRVLYVGEQTAQGRQINAAVPGHLPPGAYPFYVECVQRTPVASVEVVSQS